MCWYRSWSTLPVKSFSVGCSFSCVIMSLNCWRGWSHYFDAPTFTPFSSCSEGAGGLFPGIIRLRLDVRSNCCGGFGDNILWWWMTLSRDVLSHRCTSALLSLGNFDSTGLPGLYTCAILVEHIFWVVVSSKLGKQWMRIYYPSSSRKISEVYCPIFQSSHQ